MSNLNFLAYISGSSVLELFVTVVLCALAYWILDWGIKKMALGEMPSKILTVLVVLAVVVFAVNAILGLGGGDRQFIRWYR